jgi:two-component system, chemotaxis family, CheB/CheR fusion protein
VTSSQDADGSLAHPSDTSSDEVSAPDDFVSHAVLPFPIVGIGASAGGLDALRSFFTAATPDTGMAYVVVQHLPPDRETLMADILGRCTSMPVLQVEEGMRVEPNHVYVIRPAYTLTLNEGAFALSSPVTERGHRRPVDDFFRSLAEEQQEKSVAVILSGMGTNGTAGAQAIKAAGGLCIAQDPESAEFPGMPLSLIHAGYADQVSKPEEIPKLLTAYARQPYLDSDHADAHAQSVLAHERKALNEVLAVIRTRTGRDFTGYRRPTVLRRIQRRMGLLSMQRLQEYVAHVREHSDEIVALTNDLMINVTGFFRDPQAWEAVRSAIIKPLIAERANGSSIRAWVTACSSGEEAYTVAILLADEAERASKNLEIKIFATDTAEKALSLARAGVYPGGIESDVPLDLLDRYFDKDEEVYRVKKHIREMVVFASQDVLRDPPFSRVDLCTCRNLLIYLETEMQRRVIAMMHFSLREGGYLFLGSSETLGVAETLFETISKKWRIYRRLSQAPHQHLDVAPLSLRSVPDTRRIEPLSMPVVRPSPSLALQQALLEQFAPPTVIVDRRDRIVYYHGETEHFLTHPAGEPTYDLFELLRPHLQTPVRTALRRAIAEHQPVSVMDTRTDGQASHLRVTAAPLIAGKEMEYYRITFDTTDGAHADVIPIRRKTAIPVQITHAPDLDAELEGELRVVRRELQQTIEAFEASNEELKASNEEVISINEELQSANEELETSKEELQSLNEELITVNAQLQAKVQEIEATTNDLTNLLSSTNIAVLFLDTQLRVRRYTPAVDDLLALIPADIGRPVAHLAQKFRDGDLVEDARTVLARLIPLESEARSDSGTWYLRRTLPYRTADNRIDGVVVTFVDISARKRIEQALESSQARLQATIEHVPTAMVLVEPMNGKLMFGNRKASELFGLPFPLPFVGSDWTTLTGSMVAYHPNGRAYRIDEWPLARTLSKSEMIIEEELELRQGEGELKSLLVSSAPVRGPDGSLVACVAAFWDVSNRKRAAQALRESDERLRLLIESAVDYAIFTVDVQNRITSWNSGAQRLLGWTEAEALGRPGAMIFTPEDRARGDAEEEMRRALDHGCAVDERMHMRKDGSRFWASGTLTAMPDAQGTVRGFAKIMRDNTQRREAQENLEQALRASEGMRAAAESANRAKDEFISTVSHELRTPLNTIRLWSKMLASGKVPHEDWTEGVRMIERAATTQQQLIDDLLDVSRMASGKLRLSVHPNRLVVAIRGALDSVQPVATARGLTLSAQLSDEIGIVRVDPDRVQQVIWNLLTNAIKFTPSGGRIELNAFRDGDMVEIRVVDSGIGIRPDFLPHVFDRFRQAEVITTRTHTGLGLGLAIAKQLIELHGGTIEAHSKGEGHGAVFIVRLPAPAVENGNEEDPPVAPLRADSNRLQFKRILLVEDDPPTRDATKRLLELHGAVVQAVGSASAACEAYSIQRPAVLLCDIGLPGEDGFSLIRQIRKIEAAKGYPRVPAIALTAFARSEDENLALQAGFDRHMAKPVDGDQLVSDLIGLTQSAGGDK